jgi:hypothetical protein
MSRWARTTAVAVPSPTVSNWRQAKCRTIMPPMSSSGSASWMVRRAIVAPLSRISGSLPTIGAIATVRAIGPSVGRIKRDILSIPRISAARARSP